MTEEEAQGWLCERGWWEGTIGNRLRQFVGLVLEEADRQNLISAASRDSIWARHIVDSAQLLPLIDGARIDEAAPWVDLGTGAGFPGLVIACLSNRPMKLVEVRPLRVDFLARCVGAMGLTHVEVCGVKVEKALFEVPAGIISARAYAPLDRLLASASHLSDENTLWLLPKGRQGENELAIVRHDWQAVFHVEQSITSPESVIVTIQQLRRAAPPNRHGSHAGRKRSLRARNRP